MFLLSSDSYVVKNVPKKGRGVFANRDIPAGSVIGDYIGLIVTDDVALKKESENNNDIYAMNYHNNLCIFPRDHKEIGIHLLNHSCSANCETIEYFGHKIFFTLRRVLKGEELTIDYSFSPGYVNEKDFVYPCFCGSSSCRGTMYASNDKLDVYYSFCKKESKGQKFKWLKSGEKLFPLEKYPKEIKDNKVFNLFANTHVAPLVLTDKKIPNILELRKKIRETGKALKFINLGLKVIAIDDGRIIADK